MKKCFNKQIHYILENATLNFPLYFAYLNKSYLNWKYDNFWILLIEMLYELGILEKQPFRKKCLLSLTI